MTRSLWRHLRQSKPFENLEEEVVLQIALTAQLSGRWAVEALRPYSLSAAQYNVLRILRGARPGAIAAGKIAERMVHHDPDLTRLLDRLAAAGLAEKARDATDRRVVNVRITPRGLALVDAATKSMRATLDTKLGCVPRKKLEALADLLEVVRDAAANAATSIAAPAAKTTSKTTSQHRS